MTTKTIYILTIIFVVCSCGPRTNEEIYDSLFEKTTPTPCLKVINGQDQTSPIADGEILLHFETCPDELARILKLREFKYYKKQATKDLRKSWWPKWFSPESLGDTILIFNENVPGPTRQIIYSSLDSTKAYCEDIIG